MAVATRHEIIAFGTFELDVDASEIRKAGLRIRLSGQPFRVLLALLAQPGEVISREHLQTEVWGSNTNVDFERGLASAVNKLREALGDSADHPIYIETLSRKGYRFIAPVKVLPRPGEESGVTPTEPVAEPAPLAAVATPPLLAAPVEPVMLLSPPARAVSRRLPLVGIAAVCVALVMLAAAIVWSAARRPGPAIPRIEQLTQTNDIYPGPPNAETLLTLVTDGPRIYVPTLVAGRPLLSSLTADGSSRQPLPLSETLSNGAITDISSDGSRLLVRSTTGRQSEQPLWLVPTAGGGAQRVGEVTAHDAVWMPDHRDGILFATGDELRIVQGGGSVSPFVTLPGRAFWLRWSPDGHALRFTLQNPVNHTSELWELEAATRRARPLHLEQLAPLRGMNLCCGSWTADGRWFVFQAGDGQRSDLWAAGTGSSPRLLQLTNGPLRFYSPLPSHDGKEVFAFGITGSDALQRIDRTSRQMVPVEPFLQDGERVSFSRDQQWLAWTDSRGRLWRARAGKGEDLLQLTGDTMEVFSAQWSPDGSRLLLMARKPGEPWQIYTVKAAGGAVTPLLTDGRNLADPSWSPDGRQVVFGREADLMGQESGTRDIQILDLASHQITAVEGSDDLFSPRWSPDGQWIVALSRDQSKLVLFSLKTRSWTTLYTGGAADPVWSADSQSVVFHAFAPEHPAILQISLTGARQVLSDLTALGPMVSHNCFFGGITPDGSPLIKPHVGVGDLYAVSLPTH